MSSASTVVGCLISLGALLLATSASADAKQCVALNNEGATHRSNHELLAARAAYRSCADQVDCPAIVRDECADALNELKTAIPTLLISVVDEERHYLPAATLLVDGRSVGVDGSPLELDPGSHELVASNGAYSTKLLVLAVESEPNRALEIVVHVPALQVKRAPRPDTVPKSAPASRRSLVPAYVLGGVAAVGMASFGYFAVSGYYQKTDLDRCKPDCSLNAVHRVGTYYHLADISLGVSLVALASASYFAFLKRSDPPAPESTAFGFDVRPSPGGAIVELHLHN